MKTIKSIALTGMTALALSCVACAQTTPPTNGAPATQQAPKSTDPHDKSQGQDVSGNPQPPTSHTMQTPQSTGQNSGTGNNLVGGNSGQMANAQLTEFGMGVAELVHQPFIALRLFQRRQILALQVFDQGDLKRLTVGQGLNDNREVVERRTLGGAPAALAGDDFIGVGLSGDGADQDRLQQAVMADRPRQLLQRRLVEMSPRLELAGAQDRDRQRRSA